MPTVRSSCVVGDEHVCNDGLSVDKELRRRSSYVIDLGVTSPLPEQRRKLEQDTQLR